MKGWFYVVLVVALGWLGCAAPQTALKPVVDVAAIAVFPPNNRTGDGLLVAGTSLLERYAFKTDRITVADVLASEARWQLTQRGFTVVLPEMVDAATDGAVPASPADAAAMAARHNLQGAVLYTEIRRWEADVPFHPSFIIASVEVTLIDAASGRVLWSAAHPSRPLPTPGVVILGEAYSIAAVDVMTELLAALGSPATRG